ncbi:MAG: hypothetical protein GX621_09450 [Pirellulaceae bacterium]|nr:hypothetical protein [Pirellulaceae bacterium]
MWFWFLITVLGAATLVGIVFSKLFWWSMAAAGVVWAAGIVVEIVLVLKDERAHRRQTREAASSKALTASSEMPINVEKANA